MYYEGDSYFAALHLAGAAEEVLAVYVRTNGGTSSFDAFKQGAMRLSKYFSGEEPSSRDIANLMNRAKNSTKHKYGKGDHDVDFHAQSEAETLLDMAVADYYQLMSVFDLPETDFLRKFNDDFRPRLPQSEDEWDKVIISAEQITCGQDGQNTGAEETIR